MKKYKELIVKICLLKDVHMRDCNETIGTFLNYTMGNDVELSKLHKRTGFKHYSFCTLYPIESDMVYKEGGIYDFMIRSYNADIMERFKNVIMTAQNDDLVVLMVDEREWQHREIEKIYTITPAIATITIDKKLTCWDVKHGEDHIRKAIFNNLLKKYNHLNGINMAVNYDDVIEDIKITSKCGIIVNYKNIKMLGRKYQIRFKDNTIAQELANLSVVEGVLEGNSAMGAGFVKAVYRR